MPWYNERDYIQDINGDIYQIIAPLHPEEGVFGLQKYQRINSQDAAAYSTTQLVWIRQPTNEHFIRHLKQYSPTTAAQNIRNHPYARISSLFGTQMIVIPKNVIVTHWSPQQRVKRLYEILTQGTFEQKLTVGNIERDAMENIFMVLDQCNVPLDHLGITGSILWEGTHAQSDIDLMIYGRTNTGKILRWLADLTIDSRSLHRVGNIQLLQKAEKLAIKTGLPAETCFELLFHKPRYLEYHNRAVTFSFAPDLSDMALYPIYDLHTEFHAIGVVSITATIVNEEWGYYSPGLFFIETDQLEFIDKSGNTTEKILPKNISRIIVFDQDYSGYFHSGDRVIVKGLLQKVINCPNFMFQTNISEEIYQVAVGTREAAVLGSQYILPTEVANHAKT
jgi:predicted nucleotidyltransferase